MKIRFAFVALLAVAGLVSCNPDLNRPTTRPVLIKLSEPAKVGTVVTIQGRYLGSSQNAAVIFSADTLGNNGAPATASDIVAWSGSEIQVRVPLAARAGGGFVYVNVGGVLSNGLPFSITR